MGKQPLRGRCGIVRRVWLMVVVTVAVVTGGCTSLPKPDFEPGAAHVTVCTYNVNWGCPAVAEVVRFLSTSDADIVMLQETHAEWEKILRSQLGGEYRYCVFQEWRGAGGIAIMSKYRLQGVRTLEPGAGWFPALYAEVESPAGRLKLLSVHLRPPLSDDGSVTLSAYASAPDIHRRELEGFILQCGSTERLIVAGDFNENENSDGVRWLIESGFRDALSIYDRSSDTWRWRVGYGITMHNRYDHIVIGSGLSCTGARVTAVPASDHMPVLGVITAGKDE
jgi:endonuclease/exonuclease/phosphatase family metal-dependent hydrolase